MPTPFPRLRHGRVLWEPAALVLLLVATTGRADTVLAVGPTQGAAGIEAALAAVRDARQRPDGDARGAYRIVLAPGEYPLAAPLRLGAADAGSAQAPLIIEARVPGSVRLTGAAPLTATAGPRGEWWFQPPRPIGADEERSGGQLYVNGRRAVLAREPNAADHWLLQGGEGARLQAQPADADRLARVVGDDGPRAIVHLMQSWTSGRHRIAGLSGADVQLDPKPRWPFLKFGPRQRWYVENLPRALDAPGEWVADGGRLRYLPTAGDRSGTRGPAEARAHWPRLPQLLLLQGEPAAPVEHVIVRGIGFAYTGVPMPPGGWLDNQAATGIPAAVELNHARQVAFERCEWRALGGWALWFNRHVTDSAVRDSVFDELGAGAVRVGTEKSLPPVQRTGGIVIDHNRVTSTGLEFPGAVALWVGRSSGNRIVDNVVAHTSYTGISLGWAWGYEEPSSGDNLVEGNLLEDIGRRQLSDLGGIYTLGRSPGTVIRGNVVRDVHDFEGYGAGAWGIYNDEGSADLVVEDNVVIGTRSGGYQLHYGRDLTVQNNLFAGGERAEVRWANPGRSGRWTFRGNGVADAPNARYDVVRRAAGAPRHDGSGGDDAGPDLRAGSVPARIRGAAPGSLDLAIDGGNERQARRWREVLQHARTLRDESRGARR